MIRRLADRSIWYSLSDSVWLGATTMLSPVCVPIGSMFSMLHTVMQLSAESRITSYSSSFHPTSDFSISTWLIGLAASPPATIASNSSSVSAMPPPVPPSVYAGRTTSGRPSVASVSRASSSVCTVALGGTGSPRSSSSCRNRSRSSARRIVSSGVPSSRMPYLSSTPASASSTVRFRPVCPPSVGRMPSGLSASMTRSSTAALSGSMYTMSAMPSSVMIVAGFELTSTVVTPSSRSDLQACVPA